jgi:putative peptidoglycan lipid II flippase
LSLLSAIVARLHNGHADHYAIAKGMAWAALFVLIGKSAGAAKEIAVAWRYGVSAEVDAYLFVFNLVSWPIAVWFSVLTVVLVPLAARLRNEAPADLPRFRAELLGLGLSMALALALLTWLVLPQILGSSWAGLPPATMTIAIGMAPTLALMAPLGVLIGLFSVWTMASGRYTNTLLEGVPSLVILIALLAFSGDGTEPLVWGTLAGVAFQLAGLSVPLARRSDIEAPRFSRESPHWPTFWRGFGIVLAGQALISAVVVIDQVFAAHLGTGAIATLGYANRILALILGMGAIAVSRATLPIFSRIQAEGGDQVRRVAAHWTRLLLVLGIMAMIMGWLLAPWVVRVLFERGTFSRQDTLAVTEVLRYGLAQLPFYFSGIVLVSYASSRRLYKLVSWSGAVGLVTKIAGNALLVPMLGVRGIALSWTLMLMVTSLLFWALLFWRSK